MDGARRVWAPEPCLGGGDLDLTTLPPHAARRHLHEGETVAAGRRQRCRIELGEPFGEELAELLRRARLVCQRSVRERQHRPEVDVTDVGPHLTVVRELGVVHRLMQRAHVQAVITRQQVQRGAHGDGAHEPTILQRLGQLMRIEVGEA